jgi:predicted SAM-dependent methyltransferase
MNTDIKNFSRDGYVLLKNHMPASLIKTLSDHHDRVFPNFLEGVKEDTCFSREIPIYQNHVLFDAQTMTRFDGVPLEHRIFRGQGSPKIADTPNIYYGKRASKNIKDLDEQTFGSIFYKDILDVSCNLLGTDGLSFLEGSANRTYARYPGYPTRPHIDTYGFTYGKNNILDPADFFINALYYIDGTDKGRAPTQIFPGSHKRYDEINRIAAQALAQSDNSNNIHQSELYWELLPDDLKSSVVYVEAEPGDVLIINSNLLHTISGNDSFDRHRDVVILNFAKKDSVHFGKARNDKDFNTLQSRLAPFSLTVSNQKKAGLFQRLSGKFMIIAKMTYKNLLPLTKFLKSTSNERLPIDDMPYLNLGSGTNWVEEKTIGLDINGSSDDFGNRIASVCDVEFDLSSGNALPFENDRFSGVYSSHCIEHLDEINTKHVFKEAFRVVKPGGVFRVTVPDIELYFDNYDAKHLFFFNWIRSKNIYSYDSWLRFITREFAGAVVDDYSDGELLALYADLGRDAYLEKFQLEQNQCADVSKNIPDIHKSFWTHAKMIGFLKEAGFKDAYKTERFGSRIGDFADPNSTSFNYTRPGISLYVEGIK